MLRKLFELILNHPFQSWTHIVGAFLILLGLLGFTVDVISGVIGALFKNPVVTLGLLLIFGRALWDQLKILWKRIRP